MRLLGLTTDDDVAEGDDTWPPDANTTLHEVYDDLTGERPTIPDGEIEPWKS